MLKAVSTIKHDGKLYESGAELPKMSEEQERALLDAGSAINSDSFEDEMAARNASDPNTVEGIEAEMARLEARKAELQAEQERTGSEEDEGTNTNISNAQTLTDKPVDKMNHTELVNYAKAHDIKIDETQTNAQIKEAIKSAETPANS